MTDQSLAELTPGAPLLAPVRTAEEYAARLVRWRQLGHVMAPFTQLSALAPEHAVVATPVWIDTNTDPSGPREVYGGRAHQRAGELALAKIGLRKLADAAGVDTDSRILVSQPSYWIVRGVVRYLAADARRLERVATVEWDVRERSPRAQGLSREELRSAREHGMRHAEARAINAAIHEAGFGLKLAYTLEELRRPFIAVRVAYLPDLSDPLTRRLVTERHLASPLYPSEAPAAGDAWSPRDAAIEQEPRVVGAGPAAAPTPSGVVRVVAVHRHGALYDVIDSSGVTHLVIDDAVAEAAQAAADAARPVRLTLETREGVTILVAVTEVRA